MKQINQFKCSAIVAMAKNRVIGRQNQLPWHLPNDLKRFKSLTTGYPIIMGRKTYESIGRPLPNRINIVLTRDVNFDAPGCTVFDHPDHTLDYAENLSDEVFIIGGAEIYRVFWPKINYLYLTIVEADIEGDAYFSELNLAEWEEVSCETHAADEKHAYGYRFVELRRKIQ
jgi:dihydrofolate reductase